MTAELTFIHGPNLSGRTELLEARPGQYLGPEPSSFFSGIGSTVLEEVSLGADKRCRGVLSALGIAHLSDRNPFTLSGGEQTLVALTAIAASASSEANLDCSLEQLDGSCRYAAIRTLADRLQRLRIADNTLEEWALGFPDAIHLTLSDRSDTSLCIAGDTDFLRHHPPYPPSRLSVQGLRFAYEKRGSIIDGATFELLPGNIYLLAGRNGSGKSTLSKLLAGLLKPHSGQVRANGEFIEPWRRPGAWVSYHHQNPDVQLFSATVRRELQSAHPLAPDRELEVAIAEAFGLFPILDSHPLDLPFVLRKRVALATTLLRRCAWYILDEPTLAQDPKNSKALARILCRFAAWGAGIIVISHSTTFVEQFSGARRFQLESGKVFEMA